VLSFNQAYDILVDLSFNPGYRNMAIQSNQQGARQPLYKESPKGSREGSAARWNPGEVRPMYMGTHDLIFSRGNGADVTVPVTVS
jgi:hypothetical protein